MINNIVRLRDLCEILIGMGFSDSANKQEIKELISHLEVLIDEEIRLLKERESLSDT
ncbi:hypothetical protein [Geopsychrobacter electrodiphilus]|uniref:hypothetical protein n=1 Tax=Geopsychrobacter electrodiphilus TaxID=225196 RepID=UPI00036E9B74|nr:hypothetical protein [Geopsychrobacter electrodiphilus]